MISELYKPILALLISLTGASAAAQPAAIQTRAQAAILVDLSSGAVLFQKEADRRILPASMTKMMTTHVVFEMIAKGKIRLDRKIMVRPETWAKWHGPEAGSTMYLSSGEQVSVENLLNGLVTLSGNDACATLAEGIAGTEAAFVALMNSKARELGLRSTQFATSTGWPDGGKTYSTARDIAMLGAETVRRYPALYRKFYGLKSFAWGKSSTGAPITQYNRNPILGRIAGADGIKTGHTGEAGFNFAGSAVQNGRRLIMVVVGLPSYQARIDDSVSLMAWGFTNWGNKLLFQANREIGRARVQGGSLGTLSLIAPAELGVTYPQGHVTRYSAKIRYRGPIKPPIFKGQTVAELVITTDRLPPQISPLLAGETVEEASFLRKSWLGLLAILGLDAAS